MILLCLDVIFLNAIEHPNPQPHCVSCILGLVNNGKYFAAYKLLQQFDPRINDVSMSQDDGQMLLHRFVALNLTRQKEFPAYLERNFIQLLIEKGSNIEEHDAKNDTCLMVALKNGNYNAARCLINAGANTNLLFSAMCQTPLHRLCANPRFVAEIDGILGQNKSEHFRLCWVNRLVLPSSPLSLKELVLKKHYSLLLSLPIFTKLIPELKVEVLHAVLQQTVIFDDRYLYLITHKSEILTLLYYKIINGWCRDSKINAQDINGNTVLHMLPRGTHPRVALFLVSNGADRLIKNSSGYTCAQPERDLAFAPFERQLQEYLSQPQKLLDKIKALIERNTKGKDEAEHNNTRL
jgi:ankyrin repeat protein